MKSCAPLLLAAALCGDAHAESFSFTGFYHEETDQWRPDAQFGGWFDSQDLNGNGIHERAELSEFHFDGMPFMNGCWEEASLCYVDFSYVPGGALNFTAGYGILSSETGEAWADYRFQTGVGLRMLWNTGAGWNTNTWTWRPETTVQISGVPEPANYVMLALGLAVLGLGRRALGTLYIVPTR